MIIYNHWTFIKLGLLETSDSKELVIGGRDNPKKPKMWQMSGMFWRAIRRLLPFSCESYAQLTLIYACGNLDVWLDW